VRHQPAVGNDRDYQRRWWTLSVLCLSLVLISVANTSMNVALPTLVGELHASAGQLQWIVDAYSLVFAGLLLTAGSIGDRYGRKGALTGGLVLFGAASAMAAASHSVAGLIACRAAMGVGAALVMPATLSVLAYVFPPAERKRAVALWAGCAGAGGAGGSIVSGWLLQHFWWGSIFLNNVVVVAVALAAGHFVIPRSRHDHTRRLDPLGALLSTAGLGALVYAIIEAPGWGWGSTATAETFVVAAVLLGLFIGWELRVTDPMLDPHLFADPRFTAATTTITLIFFSMYGTNFLLTQYLQLVLGYSPLQAGLRILPIPIVYMTSSPASARLVERGGQRTVVVGGLVVLAIGMGLLSRNGLHADYPYLAVGLVITALGMGLTTAPSTGAIMETLPLDQAGVGSAVNDTTRELGGALGVAVMGSILASRFSAYIAPAAHGIASANGLPTATTTTLGATLSAAAGMPASARAALALAARRSYVDAWNLTILVAVTVVIAAAILVAYLLRPAGEAMINGVGAGDAATGRSGRPLPAPGATTT
jgi:EmrB/QacA subfamily drug resistance transporter